MPPRADAATTANAAAGQTPPGAPQGMMQKRPTTVVLGLGKGKMSAAKIILKTRVQRQNRNTP
jgi:hypothetical protein